MIRAFDPDTLPVKEEKKPVRRMEYHTEKTFHMSDMFAMTVFGSIFLVCVTVVCVTAMICGVE